MKHVTAVLLAIGFALFGNYFDSRIYDVEDAEQGLDVPVLGTIPAIPRSARIVPLRKAR